MKKIWVPIDGWRGSYEPIPPQGWELLISCSVINNAGPRLWAILKQWLRSKKIKFKSGYLRTSNVFSAQFYVVIEKGKLDEGQRTQIENWFIDHNNSTFSIFTSESYELNQAEALKDFTYAMA